MLLYSRDGVALEADLVVLGFVNADLVRLISDTESARPKPTFTIEGGQLVVSNRPVPRAGGTTFGLWAEMARASATGRALRAVVSLARNSADGWETTAHRYETAVLVVARLQEMTDAHGALAVVRLPEGGHGTLWGFDQDWSEGKRIVKYLRPTRASEGMRSPLVRRTLKIALGVFSWVMVIFRTSLNPRLRQRALLLF